jgi:hypothetical protein
MRITVIVLLLVTGLNALAAGYGFVADPSGKGLGMTTDYLRFSPFDSFLIPGIILFCFIGVFSTISAIMAIKRKRLYPVFTLVEGCMLNGWIIVQVILLRDFNWLHFSFLTVGLLLIFFGRKLMKRQRLNLEA